MPFPRPTRTLLERMEWLADYWQWHFQFAHPAIKVGAVETLLWNEIMPFSLLPRRTKLWWLELTQNGGNWAKLCRMLIVNGMYGGWQERRIASTSKNKPKSGFLDFCFYALLNPIGEVVVQYRVWTCWGKWTVWRRRRPWPARRGRWGGRPGETFALARTKSEPMVI